MAPDPKRRKIDQIQAPFSGITTSPAGKGERIAKSVRTLSKLSYVYAGLSTAGKGERIAKTVPVAQTDKINYRIQQAKTFAIAQAQQEGCTGNFRVFDSPFGNYFVPVVPTRAELAG